MFKFLFENVNIYMHDVRRKVTLRKEKQIHLMTRENKGECFGEIGSKLGYALHISG